MTKGELAYYHTTVKVGKPQEAKKLTAEEAAELERTSSGTVVGASAWNAAGTYEEVNWTQWGKTRVTQILEQVRGEFPQGSIRVEEVSKCTGDATMSIVRGKRRYGFDFEVELKWFAELLIGPQKEVKEVKGKAKLPDVSRDTVQDEEVELTDVSFDDKKKVSADEQRAVTKGLQGILPTIQAQLVAFNADMKEKVDAVGSA